MIDNVSDQIKRVRSAFNQEISGAEYCEDCGEDIPAGRRRLVPWATLCVRCQTAKECREQNYD